MNEIWVVDFYSDEDWESTLIWGVPDPSSIQEGYWREEYSLLDKLRDEAIND